MRKKFLHVRNTIKLVALATSVAALPLSTVLADWQYTRWGMKPEEVVQASGGIGVKETKPQRHSTETEIALLVAPYTTGRFTFRARFLFNKTTGGLARVHLDLINVKLCNDLHGALVSRYGEPSSEGSYLKFPPFFGQVVKL